MKFKMLWLVLWALPAAAEEGPAPWMLQPLRPPSRLAIRDLSLRVDYRERATPGTARVEAQVELTNEDVTACDEQFMILNGDAASRVTWKGRELQQERLVMQIPDSPGREMTRVSIFHLILLPREKGQLKFTGLHRLDFRSANQHRLRLIFPLRRAWHRLGESDVQVALAPELKLLSRDFQPVAGQPATFQRHFGAYSKALELSVEARAGGPEWAGALGAIPALRRAWLWGGLAALLSVTLAALSRRHWWLAVPLSLLLNLGLRHQDETVRQWTYYEDAAEYKRALDLQWYLVPLWAFLGGLGIAVLGQKKETK
ncbi:MAG: hypothetical protein KF760_14675 [Candidatus Eremiobacteraeota bacterium]|nr:hypothetical protein [Candidatus Eremiobacteraeota bacterium]